MQNGAVLNLLRRLLRRVNRRWIPNPVERDRHEATLRGRLPNPAKRRGDTQTPKG